MRILLLLFFFTAISPADFTKVQLHLHVQYINRTEVYVTCWPENRCDRDLGTYYLYNQAYPNETINRTSRAAAHLSVQQEVTVGCGQHGNLSENSINVTLFPLNNDDEDFNFNTAGIDSDTLLKCHSKLDHNVLCWKLSHINVSNEDASCNATNNSFGIISTFSPSLYSNQKLKSEQDITTLLEALKIGHNFDDLENSCVKVTGSVLQYSDITPSATPDLESACPQPTSCAAQAPCVEPGATDALNRIIQDEQTYVLVSFPILVVMFALLVLAIVIIVICLAIILCLCKKKKGFPGGDTDSTIAKHDHGGGGDSTNDKATNTDHGGDTPECDVSMNDKKDTNI